VTAKKAAAKPAKKTSSRKPRAKASAKKTSSKAPETSVAPPVMNDHQVDEPTPREPGLEGHPLHSVTSSTLNPAFS
jgi:hypothetical protein